MKIILHQTQHIMADFLSIFESIKKDYIHTPKEVCLHLYSELFLTGYPLGDVLLYKGFIEKYKNFLNQINEWSLSLSAPTFSQGYLLGGIDYVKNTKDEVEKIYNCIYFLEPGKKLRVIYRKKNIPHYDIFDESKYFSPSPQEDSPTIWSWNGFNFLLLICEDMWIKTTYSINGNPLCQEHKESIHAIINLSASPFHYLKEEERLQRGLELFRQFLVPFFYVNRIGSADEILFDGRSFIIEKEDKIHFCPAFKEKDLEFTLEKVEKEVHTKGILQATTPWDYALTSLESLNDAQIELIIESLIFGIRSYAKACGIKQFVLGLSGGLDSSLVLTLLSMAFPADAIHPVFMPSKHTSILSNDLSVLHCKKLGMSLIYYPIKFIQSTLERQFEVVLSSSLNNLAYENLQSRIRGLNLLAIANQINAVVINTSNKSEIAVGYSTIYGDSIGAISPLGDLFKTQVFQIATYLHKKNPDLIPLEVIHRPPSAELHDGQLDSDSLPPYEILDKILDLLLSQRFTQQDIIAQGFRESDVVKTFNLFERNEFKRKQFPLIIKVAPKSFGFGHRVVICKASNIFC